MLVKCLCEICGMEYGAVDTDKLFKPMRGSIFQSHDPHHGYPNPFQPEQDFESMRCIWGNHRPFTEENRIKTEKGYKMLKDPPPPPKPKPEPKPKPVAKKLVDKKKKRVYTCNICGWQYASPQSVSRHKRAMHPK